MVSPRSSCYCFNHHALQAHYCISLMLKSLMCKFIFTQPFIIIHVHTKPLQWLLVKKKMHFFLTDGASPDFLMSESWEWREGRLLAYELILKFLITNHIHYVFPTYVLPVSKASASSSSVDETLINRYRYNIRCTWWLWTPLY